MSASDAALALRLLAIAPGALGGACLHGGGEARDRLIEGFRAWLPAAAPWRRLPPHVADDRLLGGVDIAASLAAGRAVEQRGLLAEIAGGVILATQAERMGEALAGRLAQAIDGAVQGDAFALLLLDEGLEREERPPSALLDRVAFDLDLAEAGLDDALLAMPEDALPIEDVAPADDDDLASLAGVSAALGVDSVRPLLFALTTARAHAALHGRQSIGEADLQAAARLVLAPRATRFPPIEEEEEDEVAAENEPDTREPESGETQEADLPDPSEDIVLAAALAAIPPGLLEQLSAGRTRRSARSGGAGQRTRSKLRGRPLGTRTGLPRGGARLALVDTLRTAAPWQAMRRRQSDRPAGSGIIVLKDDLRVYRFEERAGAVTVFCVDASGSAAMSRLAEAKGAVERLLAQAYVKRTEVALLAFRGTEASLLLPPTRSLTRARRALAELPGGGGTPLAAGIALARQLAEVVSARGRTPFMVFLTDGSANIAADGNPGRARARADATTAAHGIAASGIGALVIDISPRPRPEAAELALAMRARYVPMPMADARALERVVSASQTEQVAA